jgi:hypothetical protein
MKPNSNTFMFSHKQGQGKIIIIIIIIIITLAASTLIIILFSEILEFSTNFFFSPKKKIMGRKILNLQEYSIC